ncbi:conserved protein of unknown function [Pseudomonas marincola]|uniref:Uncharacterized protein n=1 Tax=Pseudomonas marincola TaxID=437900 RepID=A0A653DY93_9PSED|nr:conserved protein of unknown function [Pseudomonas marincola]
MQFLLSRPRRNPCQRCLQAHIQPLDLALGLRRFDCGLSHGHPRLTFVAAGDFLRDADHLHSHRLGVQLATIVAADGKVIQAQQEFRVGQLVGRLGHAACQFNIGSLGVKGRRLCFGNTQGFIQRQGAADVRDEPAKHEAADECAGTASWMTTVNIHRTDSSHIDDLACATARQLAQAQGVSDVIKSEQESGPGRAPDTGRGLGRDEALIGREGALRRERQRRSQSGQGQHDIGAAAVLAVFAGRFTGLVICRVVAAIHRIHHVLGIHGVLLARLHRAGHMRLGLSHAIEGKGQANEQTQAQASEGSHVPTLTSQADL